MFGPPSPFAGYRWNYSVPSMSNNTRVPGVNHVPTMTVVFFRDPNGYRTCSPVHFGIHDFRASRDARF
jgi:hypothetical protein